MHKVSDSPRQSRCLPIEERPYPLHTLRTSAVEFAGAGPRSFRSARIASSQRTIGDHPLRGQGCDESGIRSCDRMGRSLPPSFLWRPRGSRARTVWGSHAWGEPWTPRHPIDTRDTRQVIFDDARKDEMEKPMTHDLPILKARAGSLLALVLTATTLAGPRMHADQAGDSDAAPEPNLQALYNAAAQGDLQTIGRLLEAGVDVNARNDRGFAATHVAAYNARNDALTMLVHGGADLQVRLKDGSTLLHMAAQGARVDGTARATTIRILMGAGVDVHATTRSGATALHLAARAEHSRVVELLLDSGAVLEARDTSGRTPLHHAAEAGSFVGTSTLLKEGADVDAVTAALWTPLHFAACHGHDRVGQELLEANAQVDTRTAKGQTALHLALENDHRSLAKTLLDLDADVNGRDQAHLSPLDVAVRKGCMGCVKWLVDRGADLNPPPGQRAPVMLAVQENQGAIARYLIDHGADTEVTDEGGATLLQVAKDNGLGEVLARLAGDDIDLAQVEPGEMDDWIRSAIEADRPVLAGRLLDRAASAGVDRDWDISPAAIAVHADAQHVVDMLMDRGEVDVDDWLFRAAASGSERVARLLLERGANVNVRDAAHWTPLHKALLPRGGSLPAGDMAMLLIDAGADPNVATAAVGWTPLHLAAALNEATLVEALLAAGARVNARTRLGHWTPLTVALRSDGSAPEATGALRSAGATATLSDTLPDLRVYTGGQALLTSSTPDQDGFTTQEVHDMLFDIPDQTVMGDGRSVHGSFTQPGADERLVFEGVGDPSSYSAGTQLVALVDRNDVSRNLFASDLYITFQGICLDVTTGTDSAIFERSYDGNCCGWPDTVYMHYDAPKDTMTEAFTDRDEEDSSGTPASSGECRWRTKADAEHTYAEILATLRVGELPDLGEGEEAEGNLLAMPMRTLPGDTVEAALAALAALPSDVATITRNEFVGARRWETVTISGGRTRDYTWGGVALLRDAAESEWRSFYDQRLIEVLGLEDDHLVAAGVARLCGSVRLGRRCYFEIDLQSYEARRIRRWDRIKRWL